MPIQPSISKGNLEIITGCMFSGKTNMLISRINLARQQGEKVVVFKPIIDTRHLNDQIISHDGNHINCLTIKHPVEIFNLIENATVIAIDEAQFFDETLLSSIDKLMLKPLRIIVSGLELDFRGQGFGIFPNLLANASQITRLEGVCAQCGASAKHTFKKRATNHIIEIGDNDLYEPRCTVCFNTK